MTDEENQELPEEQDSETEGFAESGEGDLGPFFPLENLGKNLQNRDIVSDMEDSYINYAMSVIVSRALPDVRDGLKPVHRRILYAMHQSNLTAGAKYRKSANVVGIVMAKYHPHGDSAIYMSMVRMAQDFSMRYQLVDGQGNFGSIDGDNPAAMRYTESRMTRISEALLRDIEKETVDFRPNYDVSEVEPSVLPSAYPQLLFNGSMGIAVGMATNIPPHNATEVLDALITLIKNPEISIDGLLEHIKGPDFPTGGEIFDGGNVREMYSTGRGGIMMRAKTNIEELKSNKKAIIITEIPYQVNKSELIIKIADLVRDKKIIGISDLRDESNRKGIRVVIELKKDAFPNKIINQLYKDTLLQKSFNLNMIALVDGINPKLLNIKEVLEHFLEHRFIVIKRRTQHDLNVAEARAHILEGLTTALDSINDVIETIKKSKSKEDAAISLEKTYSLSEKQSKAILEMRLQTLAGLERQKIENELAEKRALIEELKGILASKEKMSNIILEETKTLKDKFGDERKTIIHPHGLGKFNAKDTIPDEPMIILLTQENYIKRINPSAFRSQKRGGVGVIGATTKDEDVVVKTIYGTNHNDLLCFTNQGRVFSLPMHEIPESSRTAKGTPIINILQLQSEEKVTEILNLNNIDGKYIMMATTGGTVKKTSLNLFQNIRKTGIIACKIKEGEEMKWAKISSGENDVFIVTRDGKSIRFAEKAVTSTGRSSAGVRGIRLKGNDQVVEADVLTDNEAKLLVVMENGFGKMTPVNEYRSQGRGGSGIKIANVTEKTGKVSGAKVIADNLNGDIIMMTKNGQTLRTDINSVKVSGRNTQGVILMRSKDDIISSLSIIQSQEEPDKPIEKSPNPTLTTPKKDIQIKSEQQPKQEESEKIITTPETEKMKNENDQQTLL